MVVASVKDEVGKPASWEEAAEGDRRIALQRIHPVPGVAAAMHDHALHVELHSLIREVLHRAMEDHGLGMVSLGWV